MIYEYDKATWTTLLAHEKRCHCLTDINHRTAEIGIQRHKSQSIAAKKKKKLSKKVFGQNKSKINLFEGPLDDHLCAVVWATVKSSAIERFA